ncbi:MAG: cytochrome o ubiquinol oxidase subunit III [Candidatus Saccharimonadales bacterium]
MTVITTPAQDHERSEKTNLDLWVYLMTDVILFGCLFATYAVLYKNTYGGPSGAELFDLPFILISTLLLLTSSYTSGLAILAMRRGSKAQTLAWLGFTAALGVTFLILEFTEFRHLVETGNSWERSGFLTAFFTLVGTHGLHIAIGLLWAATLAWQVARRGLTTGVRRRLPLFSMFWHFLDVIWIFIFTLVYLMGAVQL